MGKWNINRNTKYKSIIFILKYFKMSRDIFGKLRISNQFTLFSYYPSLITSVNIDNDILTNNTNGTATITYNSSNYIDIACSASSSNGIVQTKQAMEYLPGKCQLIYLTGVLLSRTKSLGESFTSRIGLFNVDSSNPPVVTDGSFLQTDGDTLQLVDVTQLDTTTVNQSSWNIDVFNGSGVSGKTLSIASANTVLLLVIERGWLGVGGVRIGFIIDNAIYYAHNFSHSSLSVQYTKTPKQQITYQMIGTTLTSSISNRMMCSTNVSEGGYLPLGRRSSINTSITGITLGTIGRKYILLALKVNSLYKSGSIKPINISIAYKAGVGDMGFYELQLHTSSIGSISAALTYNTPTNSAYQYFIGDAVKYLTVDGYSLTSGFVNSNTNIRFTSNDFETLLHRTICTANNGDILYLFGAGNANNDIMYASLDFIETI